MKSDKPHATHGLPNRYKLREERLERSESVLHTPALATDWRSSMAGQNKVTGYKPDQHHNGICPTPLNSRTTDHGREKK